MSKAKPKFYVVWKGVNPGIYTSWAECKQQVHGYDSALYKSFSTKEEAEEAYNSPAYSYFSPKKKSNRNEMVQPSNPPAYRTDPVLPLPSEVLSDALAVDAACSGNPGPMEYRGVYLRTGQEIFHLGPLYGTNNIGEFLAIVHALALLKQRGLKMTIYSDSRNAIGWVQKKKCKTKLEHTPRTEELHQLIARAEKWLAENEYDTPIVKWETSRWGEVPADFGRK